MNSAHDLGGMHGFGPVRREPDEPVFHADWERRAFAATVLSRMQGFTPSTDANRHARERIGNGSYLSSTYYEIWLAATVAQLIDAGIVTEDELDARAEAMRADPEVFVLPPARGPDALSQRVETRIRAGGSTRREIDAAPTFSVGDEVITTRRSPKGHTRLPRYARGCRGHIVIHHGAHVFPDTNAHGLGECPEHLYTVRFDATELWGDAAEGRGAVHVDLWESYLSRALESSVDVR